MKDSEQVMDALKTGPGTSGEIAAELGWTTKKASAVLCALRTAGLVKTSGEIPGEGSARPSNIWELNQ